MTSTVVQQSLGSLGTLQLGWPGKHQSTESKGGPEALTEAHILTTGDLAYLDAPVGRPPAPVGAVLDRYRLQSGDLLFNVRNRPFRVSVVEAAGTQAPIVALGILASFRAHQGSALNPSYLAGLLRSTYGQQLVQPFMQTSTSTTTINLKKLEHLQVPLPAREEQDRLARMFRALEEVRRAQEATEQQRLAYVDAMIRWTVKA